jgi:arginase
MSPDDWFLITAPWDCSGTGRAERDAPTALRAKGLAKLVGADLGDAATNVISTERDRETGVRALSDTLRAAHALSEVVTRALQEMPERRALVIGGDCSLLLGVFPALRQTLGRVCLWFVDGHPDYLDGAGSDTGETADMDLAILTGEGPAPLVGLGGPPPMVALNDVVLVGHRTRGLDPASAAELARLPAGLRRIDAPAVIDDPRVAGAAAAAMLGERGPKVWLHVDVDVLDEKSLPAVTYPQLDGPDWDQLAELIRPLTAVPGLVGVSVADYRPDLDPDGGYARRIVELLQRTLP